MKSKFIKVLASALAIVMVSTTVAFAATTDYIKVDASGKYTQFKYADLTDSYDAWLVDPDSTGGAMYKKYLDSGTLVGYLDDLSGYVNFESLSDKYDEIIAANPTFTATEVLASLKQFQEAAPLDAKLKDITVTPVDSTGTAGTDITVGSDGNVATPTQPPTGVAAIESIGISSATGPVFKVKLNQSIDGLAIGDFSISYTKVGLTTPVTITTVAQDNTDKSLYLVTTSGYTPAPNDKIDFKGSSTGKVSDTVVTFTYVAPKATTISLAESIKSTTFKVPTSGTFTADVVCSVVDQYGNDISSSSAPAWALKVPTQGVSLLDMGVVSPATTPATYKATVTVDQGAVAGTEVILTATAGTLVKEFSFTLSSDASVAKFIQIATSPAVTSIAIPGTGSTSTVTFSATLTDQYGKPFAGSSTMAMVPETVAGVTFTPSTGVLSVTSAAAPGTIKITAVSGDVTAEKEFTITSKNADATAKAISIKAGADADHVTELVSGFTSDVYSYSLPYSFTTNDKLYINVTKNAPLASSVTYAFAAAYSDGSPVTLNAGEGSLANTATSGVLDTAKSSAGTIKVNVQIISENGVPGDFYKFSLEKAGAAPSVSTIDYTNESVKIEGLGSSASVISTYEYSTDGTTFVSFTTNDYEKIYVKTDGEVKLTNYIPTTGTVPAKLYIRKKAAGGQTASMATMVSVPVRPAALTGLSLLKGTSNFATQILGASLTGAASYEYNYPGASSTLWTSMQLGSFSGKDLFLPNENATILIRLVASHASNPSNFAGQNAMLIGDATKINLPGAITPLPSGTDLIKAIDGKNVKNYITMGNDAIIDIPQLGTDFVSGDNADIVIEFSSAVGGGTPALTYTSALTAIASNVSVSFSVASASIKDVADGAYDVNAYFQSSDNKAIKTVPTKLGTVTIKKSVPKIEGAVVAANGDILIAFNEFVFGGTQTTARALTSADFSYGVGGVSTVTPESDGKTYRLKLVNPSEASVGGSLKVSGVFDVAGNSVDATASVVMPLQSLSTMQARFQSMGISVDD